MKIDLGLRQELRELTIASILIGIPANLEPVAKQLSFEPTLVTTIQDPPLMWTLNLGPSTDTDYCGCQNARR